MVSQSLIHQLPCDGDPSQINSSGRGSNAPEAVARPGRTCIQRVPPTTSTAATTTSCASASSQKKEADVAGNGRMLLQAFMDAWNRVAISRLPRVWSYSHTNRKTARAELARNASNGVPFWPPASDAPLLKKIGKWKSVSSTPSTATVVETPYRS